MNSRWKKMKHNFYSCDEVALPCRLLDLVILGLLKISFARRLEEAFSVPKSNFFVQYTFKKSTKK